MKNRWTLTKLIAAGALGVLTTLISLPGSFIIVFVYGAFGGFLAWKIFNKIKGTAVIKRIQK